VQSLVRGLVRRVHRRSVEGLVERRDVCVRGRRRSLVRHAPQTSYVPRFSSGPPKTLKDIEALVADLKPDKPFRSVSFAGNNLPSLNSYHFFLAGSWVPAAVAAALPAYVGHVPATSSTELYAYFRTR
jgi:hypothetical protein